MSFRSTLKVVEKFAVDNAPTLMSGVAVAGTVTTAYLTGKATFKAAELLADEQAKRDLHEIEELRVFPKRDKVLLVWREYIPPAIAVTGTVALIVAANHVSGSRIAAVAAAYKLSEKQINEYKEKVIEKFGENKEREVRDELAQDEVRKNPPREGSIQVLPGDNDVMFLEKWTGRYFKSDMQAVKHAMVETNRRAFIDKYCTLSDFYDNLGLDRTSMSSEIGWSIEEPMDLQFSTTMTDREEPCIVLEYRRQPTPIRDFHQYDASYEGSKSFR